jgi:FkbH-like protein
MLPDNVLPWLPELPNWHDHAKGALAVNDAAEKWRELVRLAGTRVDLLRTSRLDLMLRKAFSMAPGEDIAPAVRVAMLGTSTLAHLHGGIRVGLLRRGFFASIYEPDYGQVFQELSNLGSGFYDFAPDVAILSEDARQATREVRALANLDDTRALVAASIKRMEANWGTIRDRARCQIVQQTIMPAIPNLLGSNEHRLASSQSAFARRLNDAIREAADRAGVDVLAIDDLVQSEGLGAWHDPSLWCSAKQEISPRVAHIYGDAAARIVAARKGRSGKCLVLDLDNTLWGGVIGDDGLDGIVLGQGSARGEGFLQFQEYALAQAQRGIILAVVSKNDEANALLPFESHPDMLLRKKDISCFIANWEDKATNIRRVAQELNIGLDSLVFVDDNPFERELVRRELPMVSVPEVSENPAEIPGLLAAAGYFEGVAVTAEDLARTESYRANRERADLLGEATDLGSYLQSLEMDLRWGEFDTLNLTRVTQLINKTNQFNLTTRRYSEEEVREVIASPADIGLHFRLLDKFGDNGIIGILIGRGLDDVLVIDTWLMSCRVLGREVESAMLNVLCESAVAAGHVRIEGRFIPTAKNSMVRDLYDRLGFDLIGDEPGGERCYSLDLSAFQPGALPMTIGKVMHEPA